MGKMHIGGPAGAKKPHHQTWGEGAEPDAARMQAVQADVDLYRATGALPHYKIWPKSHRSDRLKRDALTFNREVARLGADDRRAAKKRERAQVQMVLLSGVWRTKDQIRRADRVEACQMGCAIALGLITFPATVALHLLNVI